MPDLSPEARRRRARRLQAELTEAIDQHITPRLTAGGRWRNARVLGVIKRVWAGTWHDGFIHAGNLAYMAMLSLFPFFVTVGAVFSLLGEQAQRAASVHTFLIALPPVVAAALEPVAQDVIVARSGWLLWVGGVVGLWTVGSLIETFRDILRRAYGTRRIRAAWRHRLISTGVIVVAVIALLFALIAQVAIATAQQVVAAWFPRMHDVADALASSRFLPALVLYPALYLLFLTLTPSAYRARRYPKWPGAALVTAWWVAVSMALPVLLHRFLTYDLTYGSLAGVMIALFFFWLVGLGMVIGAELNAALAESPEERDAIGQADDRLHRAGGDSPSEKGRREQNA